MMSSPYKDFRYPQEIISHAVWVYFRLSLSYRDVEELLGVGICQLEAKGRAVEVTSGDECPRPTVSHVGEWRRLVNC